MCSATSLPMPGKSENVGTLMVTSYPTPPVSTMAWLGCLANNRPRKWAIMLRHCNAAREDHVGTAAPAVQPKLSSCVRRKDPLEQRALFPVRSNPKMLVSQLRRHPPAWGAVQETNLNQKRLVDFFNRIRLFCQCCRQRVHPNRATLIFFNNRQQQFSIDFVKAMTVHFQHLQRCLCRRQVDLPTASYLSVITHSSQQTVCNTRRPTRTAGNLKSARLIYFYAENVSGPFDNDPQILVGIELQPQHNSEPRPQRRREQPRSRGRTDKSKRLHIHGMGARRRPLPDDDVQLVILERRI